MLLQVCRIVGERVELQDHHAPQRAPVDGIWLVLAEINPARLAQLRHDGKEVPLMRRGRNGLGQFVGLFRLRDFEGCLSVAFAVVERVSARVHAHVGMVLDAADFRCDVLRSQYEIHAAGVDCAARHPVVFGRGGFLGKCNAALRLDVFQP